MTSPDFLTLLEQARAAPADQLWRLKPLVEKAVRARRDAEVAGEARRALDDPSENVRCLAIAALSVLAYARAPLDDADVVALIRAGEATPSLALAAAYALGALARAGLDIAGGLPLLRRLRAAPASEGAHALLGV